MKKLESLKSEKFENLKSYKVSNLAAIVGGKAQGTCASPGGPTTDYSYDIKSTDGCWTKTADGDTAEKKGAESTCY